MSIRFFSVALLLSLFSLGALAIDIIPSNSSIQLTKENPSQTVTYTINEIPERFQAKGKGNVKATIKIDKATKKIVSIKPKKINIKIRDGQIQSSKEITFSLKKLDDLPEESQTLDYEVKLPKKQSKRLNINNLNEEIIVGNAGTKFSGRVVIPAGEVSNFGSPSSVIAEGDGAPPMTPIQIVELDLQSAQPFQVTLAGETKNGGLYDVFIDLDDDTPVDSRAVLQVIPKDKEKEEEFQIRSFLPPTPNDFFILDPYCEFATRRILDSGENLGNFTPLEVNDFTNNLRNSGVPIGNTFNETYNRFNTELGAIADEIIDAIKTPGESTVPTIPINLEGDYNNVTFNIFMGNNQQPDEPPTALIGSSSALNLIQIGATNPNNGNFGMSGTNILVGGQEMITGGIGNNPDDRQVFADAVVFPLIPPDLPNQGLDFGNNIFIATTPPVQENAGDIIFSVSGQEDKNAKAANSRLSFGNKGTVTVTDTRIETQEKLFETFQTGIQCLLPEGTGSIDDVSGGQGVIGFWFKLDKNFDGGSSILQADNWRSIFFATDPLQNMDATETRNSMSSQADPNGGFAVSTQTQTVNTKVSMTFTDGRLVINTDRSPLQSYSSTGFIAEQGNIYAGSGISTSGAPEDLNSSTNNFVIGFKASDNVFISDSDVYEFYQLGVNFTKDKKAEVFKIEGTAKLTGLQGTTPNFVLENRHEERFELTSDFEPITNSSTSLPDVTGPVDAGQEANGLFKLDYLVQEEGETVPHKYFCFAGNAGDYFACQVNKFDPPEDGAKDLSIMVALRINFNENQ